MKKVLKQRILKAAAAVCAAACVCVSSGACTGGSEKSSTAATENTIENTEAVTTKATKSTAAAVTTTLATTEEPETTAESTTEPTTEATTEATTETATQTEVREQNEQQNDVIVTEITVTEVEPATEEGKTAFVFTDENGNPVEGLRIHLSPHANEGTTYPSICDVVGTTDSNGRVFWKPTDGNHELEAYNGKVSKHYCVDVSQADIGRQFNLTW